MATDLDDLERKGLIAPKRSDARAVRTWAARSRDDIAASKSLASDHPIRAITIAYEASLRACAGILDLAGRRVRSQQGHHWATIAAARAVLGSPYDAVIERLDRARRYRNDDLYGEAAPPSAAQLEEAISDAEALIAEVERRLA